MLALDRLLLLSKATWNDLGSRKLSRWQVMLIDGWNKAAPNVHLPSIQRSASMQEGRGGDIPTGNCFGPGKVVNWRCGSDLLLNCSSTVTTGFPKTITAVALAVSLA